MSHRPNRIRLLAALALAALLLTACGGGGGEPADGASDAPASEAAGGDDAKTVAVVTPYYANAATKEVVDNVKEEGEAKGWKVDVTDTAGDFDKLNSAIQDAVSREVDAIVLGMGDPAQIGRGLKAAASAEVPVFSIDAAPAEGIVANVTSDNADLGEQSAGWLAETLGNEGNVLMFTHDPHPGVKARAAAAEKVLTDAGIKVVNKIHVEVPGPVDDARTSMQDFLTANPGEDAIDGVWAGWDEPALGATQAIESANRDGITVVGVDGQDFALAEIKKDGPFGATVKQDWDAIAKRVVELVDGSFAGEKPDSQQIELPGQLTTAQDL